MDTQFNLEDASQVTVGAFALAVPLSFSEEAWKLGETLPPENLAMLFVLSIAFLGFYAYGSVFQADIQYRVPAFFLRISIAYLITVLVVLLILFALNKLPVFSDPEVALNRLVVIAMPASMGAIIVDGFDKE